jgi:DNA invertase Pin-like site-specific DNA recombinase
MSDVCTSENTDNCIPLFRKAAMYVRTATADFHQRENQTAAIMACAKRYRMEIVATYEDYGKSGFISDGRAGLQRLLQDIRSGNAPFSFLLLSDISRWGRFQETDESTHYEHVCRRAGIEVIYVDEALASNKTQFSHMLRILKQAMPARYSREPYKDDGRE